MTCSQTHPDTPEGASPVRENIPQSGTVFDYIRDPDEISRRSFAVIDDLYDFSGFPDDIAVVARRLIHARGDGLFLDQLSWSAGAAYTGAKALAAGAPIFCDSHMTVAGIMRNLLPADTPILCTLNDPHTTIRAQETGMTRSAAAVELWQPRLAGAVAVIGNAPTALFHLLELLSAGGPQPSLIIGFPVGFIGAAESKKALIDHASSLGIAYLSVTGHVGGSALAAAAINALATAASS